MAARNAPLLERKNLPILYNNCRCHIKKAIKEVQRQIGGKNPVEQAHINNKALVIISKVVWKTGQRIFDRCLVDIVGNIMIFGGIDRLKGEKIPHDQGRIKDYMQQ